MQLGYIPSERAVLIGKLMREGHDVTAVFQAHAAFGGWCRVAFDGDQPVLPQITAAAPADTTAGEAEEGDGFYPDPIYDD